MSGAAYLLVALLATNIPTPDGRGRQATSGPAEGEGAPSMTLDWVDLARYEHTSTLRMFVDVDGPGDPLDLGLDLSQVRLAIDGTDLADGAYRVIQVGRFATAGELLDLFVLALATNRAPDAMGPFLAAAEQATVVLAARLSSFTRSASVQLCTDAGWSLPVADRSLDAAAIHRVFQRTERHWTSVSALGCLEDAVHVMGNQDEFSRRRILVVLTDDATRVDVGNGRHLDALRESAADLGISIHALRAGGSATDALEALVRETDGHSVLVGSRAELVSGATILVRELLGEYWLDVEVDHLPQGKSTLTLHAYTRGGAPLSADYTIRMRRTPTRTLLPGEKLLMHLGLATVVGIVGVIWLRTRRRRR